MAVLSSFKLYYKFYGGKNMNLQDYLEKMSDFVVDMEDEEIVDLAEDYVAGGFDPLVGINQGLIDGMNRASKLYEEEEYFVSDLLLCSDAMYAGLDTLKKYLPETSDDANGKIKVVIGVVEGDTHDIGKNLVKMMLETAGFEVHDLGRDVPANNFIEKAKEVDANLICLSALMTTTMKSMELIIDKVKEEKLENKIKVIVGVG